MAIHTKTEPHIVLYFGRKDGKIDHMIIHFSEKENEYLVMGATRQYVYDAGVNNSRDFSQPHFTKILFLSSNATL